MPGELRSPIILSISLQSPDRPCVLCHAGPPLPKMAYAYTPEEVSHRKPANGGPVLTTFLGYVAGIALCELLDIGGTNEFVRDRPVRRHGESGRRRI